MILPTAVGLSSAEQTCTVGAMYNRKSGCQPDSASGLPARSGQTRQASSLAAESARLADFLKATTSGSIQIRLGKRERIPDQFNTWLRVISDDDFNNIESEKDVGIIEHSQPGQRTARDSLLFFPIHRFERPTKIFACACFYFHKYERVLVTTDNVDLATAATAEIAQQDFVTATLEVAAR